MTVPSIRKAVFPVAGLGTRFLPATKSMPKEMLTVVDKPVIHYAVEEAKAAGIQQFIFITGKGKTAIEDYFDHNFELEQALKQKNREYLLEDPMRGLPKPEQIVYVRQPEARGLGHAVACARDIIGDEPFAVLLSDVLVLGEKPCLSQMMEVYQQNPSNLISVEEVAPEETRKYGIMDVENREGPGSLFKIRGMVEKPDPKSAPSNLAVTGRYIIQPQIFDYLAEEVVGTGGEIQLTDALARLIKEQPSYAFLYKGVRYDCGDKSGWLEANIAYSLSRPDLRQETLRMIEHYSKSAKKAA